MKTVLLAIAASAVTLAALLLGISKYDQYTRKKFDVLIDKELGRNASVSAMDAFMRRHTAGYSVDTLIDHQYAGIVKQDRLDKILFDRSVRIVLRLNHENNRMVGSNVEIHYTFL